MSENTFDENLFRDYYKAENSDDEENNNDLVTRLYADIYYPSNNEIELEADILSNAVPLSSCIINNSTNTQESIQNNLNNKVISEVEVAREQEESAAKEFIRINEKNSADQETSNIAERWESKKNLSKKHKSPKQPKNKPQKRPQKKKIALVDESLMDTKYNVLNKNMKRKIQLNNARKETLEDSDSESIFEVPVPPKPKPLLINLQDSDDEDAGSLIDEDDLLEGRLQGKNASKDVSRISDSRSSFSPEVEIIEMPLDHQDIATESNRAHKSPRNKNNTTTMNDKSKRAHEIHEDIVLNCTMIQKGARSINEIKQLSKSAKQNWITTSVEGTSSKSPSQNASKGDNSSGDTCMSQEPYRTSQERRIETGKQIKKLRQNVSSLPNDNYKDNDTSTTVMNDLRDAVQTLEDTLLEVSCGINDNLVMSQKRHSEDINEEERGDGEGGENEEIRSNNSARKRQCTVMIQQSDQSDVELTPQSSDKRTNRSDSFWSMYFFAPQSEYLKKFYNDSRGQENFDIYEIQRNMSKDPRKWAILDEDLMPSPAVKRGSRYWSGLRCTYCQRDGHLRKDCPEPPKIRCCHMCGKRGHVTWRCPQQVCLTCGKKQNTFRKNCEHCRTLYCIMCCSVGHKKEDCPDLWRRYHSVTREIGRAPRNPGNVMKPPSQLHCCNCSKRGHESSTCKEYRWSTHFPTPAFVTSYTEGPVYESQINPERISMSTKTPSVASFKTKSNRTLNQQMHENTLAAHMAPPPDIDTSSSSVTAETDKEIYTRSTQTQVMTISEFIALQFVTMIYCCGNFRHKNNNDARALVSNLSRHKELYSEGKKFLQSKFSNNTVFPVFLKKLRKIVEFEIMIGLLAGDSEVMVQLIAPKDCIYLLFNLLLYWLNLPLDEKQHGLDVNLPWPHIGQMYNFLQALNISHKYKNIKDPLKLYYVMNGYKNKLLTMLKNKEYFHKQTNMWNLQKKLLLFINTHPQPSVNFHKICSYMETFKCRNVSDQLDAATYLDILLSYNNIYTPHTPPNLRNTLRDITMQQTAMEEQRFIQEQQFPSNANVNPSTGFIPLATSSSCTPQETDIIVNPFAVANIQNVPDDTPNVVEVGDVNICQPGISNAVVNPMQYPENILSLDAEPVSIQLGNSQRENNQRSTDNVNTNTNLPVTKPKVIGVITRNKKQKPLIQAKRRSMRLKNKMERFQQEAKKIVNEAETFQLPYMKKAADDVLKKLGNQTLTNKDLQKVRKMIKMENKHQKMIKNLCSHLN